MSSIEVPHHTGLFNSTYPSGVSVKVWLLFIPVKRLQPPVLSVCCSLIDKSLGGHLHVLHENIQPSMVPCKQSTKEIEWKKYRKSNQATGEKMFPQSVRKKKPDLCSSPALHSLMIRAGGSLMLLEKDIILWFSVCLFVCVGVQAWSLKTKIINVH